MIKSIVFLVAGDGMGQASDQELREILVGTPLRLLGEADELPKAICFYTDGQKLT